jgi:hypothetical protein
MAAQDEMLAASLKVDKAKNFKPTVHLPENDVQIRNTERQAPKMDQKTAEWVSENPWFVNPEKDYMAAYAKRVHSQIAKQYGESFVGTDAYYKAINKEVQRKFPDEFDDIEKNDEPKTQRTQKLSTVVAPAKRSTASKKVVLTNTQVALAKKFGLSPEQYARELTKLES